MSESPSRFIPTSRFLVSLFGMLCFASVLFGQADKDLPKGNIEETIYTLKVDTLVQGVKGVFVRLKYSADLPGTPPKGASREEIPGAWKLTAIDRKTQIDLFTKQRSHNIEGEGHAQIYTEFLPYSLFPYPGGPQEIDFVLSFTDSEGRELYSNKGKEQQTIDIPEMSRIHLEFGNFAVKPNTFKGRRWDRPFIFGNGIPEFFWSLRVGNATIYESNYIEDHGYPRVDEVDFRWVPGTIVTIQVDDEDDIKRDFAGSTPIFSKSSDLPINDPKTSFDLVYDGFLKAETVPRNQFDRLDSLEVTVSRVKGDMIDLAYELHFREMDLGDDLVTCAEVHLLHNGAPARMFLSGLKGKMIGASPPMACPGSAQTEEPFVYETDFTGSLEGYSFRVDYYVKQHDRVIELSSTEYPFEVVEAQALALTPAGSGLIWIIAGILLIGGVVAGIAILATRKKKTA